MWTVDAKRNKHDHRRDKIILENRDAIEQIAREIVIKKGISPDENFLAILSRRSLDYYGSIEQVFLQKGDIGKISWSNISLEPKPVEADKVGGSSEGSCAEHYESCEIPDVVLFLVSNKLLDAIGPDNVLVKHMRLVRRPTGYLFTLVVTLEGTSLYAAPYVKEQGDEPESCDAEEGLPTCYLLRRKRNRCRVRGRS